VRSCGLQAQTQARLSLSAFLPSLTDTLLLHNGTEGGHAVNFSLHFPYLQGICKIKGDVFAPLPSWPASSIRHGSLSSVGAYGWQGLQYGTLEGDEGVSDTQ